MMEARPGRGDRPPFPDPCHPGQRRALPQRRHGRLIRCRDATGAVPGQHAHFNVLPRDPGQIRHRHEGTYARPGKDGRGLSAQRMDQGRGRTGVITYGATTPLSGKSGQSFQADFDSWPRPSPPRPGADRRSGIPSAETFTFSRTATSTAGRVGTHRGQGIGKARYAPSRDGRRLNRSAMGYEVKAAKPPLPPVPRHPLICAACPTACSPT
jgi:hypothetical protein